MMSELEALSILCRLPSLGPLKIKKLIKHFGSALECLKASESEVGALLGLKRQLDSWKSWEMDLSWQEEQQLADKLGIKRITYTDESYPISLLDLPDAPLILYVKGELLSSDTRSIAIVGTRQASIYGKEMAAHFAKDLVRAGFTIVSGLARGVDTAAHLGAMQEGRTIAIIGSGLANIYPPENRELADKMIQNGAIMSEFPLNTPPDRQNFPQRNRIVSGMTMATLLVEAPIKSGAMITVERAQKQNKPIFVLPGRVDWDGFKGNHLLIKKKKGLLVESPHDIIEHFNELSGIKKITSQISASLLNAEEKGLFDRLPKHEVSFDDIIQLTHLPVMKVTTLLIGMTLKNQIKEFPGKIYRKIGGPLA